MIYYLVHSYHKEENKVYKSHLYPAYLSSYDGKSHMIQGNTHDALKFEGEEDAVKAMERAQKIFTDRELEVVPYDSRILGRAEQKYVVPKGQDFLKGDKDNGKNV